MPRGSISPEMEQLLEKKNQIEKSLENLEKQIFALETSYLEDTNHVGNLVRGWDGYLSRGRSNNAGQRKRLKDSDRLFSLSSVTSGVQVRPDDQ
uniref:Chromatin modification-related protein MEAF6 n=1 Tax=Paramoeba aestuarina TaxID=180227 RepID=A0A7S4NZW5_9EUKA